ncbi:LAS seventeen-binding protein-like protein [Amylocarpus encephaloides]|uniref:LAS seventeen-binding protein-like protein n=1 Tax=Amylocarpus encephaloides TaxID=45428 RepID=A0A9P7YHK2_9HELO|nr:LAS seventeen-binding protein-like protein [Amylocarpus encephaloides]
MNRVTSILPSWDKTKTGGKRGFDKAWTWADKLGAPINKFSNKIGSEAFWPTTLDKESDKAARILKSFCKDGFYAEEDRVQAMDMPAGKQRVLKKIPQKVIEKAIGLAIFTTMRTGLWVSGSGGSGVLLARKENGEWSPPSGIMLHTAGLGFLVGVDIYDCVVVINNRKALEAFTKIRATLGGEISAVAGPVGVGGVLENDGKWKQANRPVFTYLKSRGFYAGVQVDGTVIIERTDENERFYGERIGVADILAGKARHPPYEIKMLMETVKAAEGRTDFDRDMMEVLEDQPAPGDVDVVSPTTASGPTFGIPEPDDPDPFGVLALEKFGLEIKEAGTKSRPPSSQFEYNPSPTSPIFGRFQRRSMDTLATHSNRESYMSTRSSRTRTSIDRSTQTTEMGTQTNFDSPSISPSHSDENKRIVEEDETPLVKEPEDVDYTKIDLGPYSNLNRREDFESTPINDSPRENDLGHDGTEQLPISIDTSFVTDDEDDDDEEPVIFEAASAQATVLTPSVIKARGGVVNIPKRPPPPPLPPRNSARSSRNMMIDQASGRSPVRSSFEEVSVHGSDKKSQDVTPDKEIMFEDLEKTETAVATAGQTLDEKEDHIQEDQHVDYITPASEIATEAKEAKLADKAVQHEAEKSKASTKLPGGFDDGYDFQSLPVTPIEKK